MNRFFKWLFNIQDTPQDLLSETWFRMERAMIEQEIADADSDYAKYKYKRDGCHNNDPKRAAWQECLEGAMTRRMDAHNRLMDLHRQVGAL